MSNIQTNSSHRGFSRSSKTFVLFLLSAIQLQLLSQPNGTVQVQAIEQNTFRAVSILRKANEQDRKERQQQSKSKSRGPATTTAHEASSKPSSSSSSSQLQGVQELRFQQRLDHFRSDPRTFSQRYFYSDQYVYSNSNSKTSNHTDSKETTHKEYAFLCCGGEGPDLDESVLVDSVHCSGDMLELAAILFHHHNASVHLYALEHRYYGQSYPSFPDKHNGQPSSPVTNENLVYLSSRQAVTDIGHFISSMQHGQHDATQSQAQTQAQAPTQAQAQTQDSLSSTVKWVTFGGSYPGMVAAWARLKYPHAVAAAVSNSAPLQAQLDFVTYNQHVAADLSNPLIGGSDECLDVFVTGHAMLARMVQNEENHETIAQAFGLCDANALQNSKSVQLFLGDGVYHANIQGNDPSCKDSPLCSIDKVCSALLEQRETGASPVDALAWIAAKDKELNQDDCTDLDWKALLDYFADPVRGQKDGLRSWLWQTCTEFGFYQTCEDNSTCPFGRGYHPIEQDLEMCEYAFGVDPAQVKANIQETLDYYGGLHLAGSRILSVNGDVDPWSELAKKTTNDPDLPVLTVIGASHHFWTHAVKPTDGSTIEFAREIIYQTVMDWLDETGDDDDDYITPPTRQPDTRAFASS
jgi:serine protease 16